jgi:hypothetical protein
MATSTRSFAFPATSLFYRGDELFATTATDVLDKDESIVGHTGSLVRIVGAKQETVFPTRRGCPLGRPARLLVWRTAKKRG